MKAKYNILMALLLMLAFAACDSSDDDDDSSTDDDAQVDDDSDTDDDSDSDDDSDTGTYPGCEENIVPEFISITVIVNGVPVEEPVTLTTNDTLAFSIEYYDMDCNFHMDQNRWGCLLTGPTENDAYNLPPAVADAFHQGYFLEGIGCSSAEDGPFVLQIDPNDYAVPEGTVREDPLWIYLYDACLEAHSNILDLDFTVYPAK